MTSVRHVLLAAAVLLAGCSSSKVAETEKPAPLTSITASAQLDLAWNTSVGKAKAAYLLPAVVGDAVFAANTGGDLYRIERGRSIWRTNADVGLVAGVGASKDIVVVGGLHGVVLGFEVDTGKLRWKTVLLGEISVPPFVDASTVLVRVGDSRIVSLDPANGETKWFYERATPPLSLRTFDEIRRVDNFIFSGFAGGKLVALTASAGQLAWEGSVSLPRGTTELERLSDVVGAPVLAGKMLCAGAYQGKVTCFDVTRGVAVWGRDIPTAVGIDADNARVFVTDERSSIYALDLATGATLWKQDGLRMRQVGRPLVVGDNIAVADFEGWVHLLDKKDGHFTARVKTDGSPILAPLIRSDEGFVAQTTDGGVFAFRTR